MTWTELSLSVRDFEQWTKEVRNGFLVLEVHHTPEWERHVVYLSYVEGERPVGKGVEGESLGQWVFDDRHEAEERMADLLEAHA